jgi:uncharacterized protein
VSSPTIAAVNYPDYQPSLDSPPLSDEELRSLDEWLAALPGDEAMNVEMLDGYLTALLLAPQPVAGRRGADWLPAVWGGDGSDDPSAAPFSSSKQKKRAIVAVLRHLHAIDQALRRDPDQWEPVFSVAEDADGCEWADAEDWCIGFLHATAQDPEGWGRLFDDPVLGPLLTPIGLLGGADSGLADDDGNADDPEPRDALSRAVPDAVLALAARRS